MPDKNLLFRALKGEVTERPAWVPFVGVHGGFLIDAPADTYLQSGDLLLQGFLEAHRRYRPDGLPLLFDLQLEAEVLGCALKWAKDSPPAVQSHPLEATGLQGWKDLPAFSTQNGRFPMVAEYIADAKKAVGADTALYGLITGPFTLALHLRGNEIFLDMFDEAEELQKLMEYCTGVARETARFYLDHGADVIAVVDPMTSQISPEHFAEFVTPHVNSIFDFVREKGALSSMFVCGNATRNLPRMCETTADNVSIDENISLEMLRLLADTHKKSFGGNLKLTVVLLMGSPADAAADTLRCLDAAGKRGFVLAPGCDLPYNTPAENLQRVAEIVLDPYHREIARQTAHVAKADDFSDIPVPSYGQDETILVDVVTLNSDSCAPCYYMVRAAEQAAKQSGRTVEVREHKINSRTGLAYMTKLGVDAIPTICIEGIPSFSSIIPDIPTLVERIHQARPSNHA